MREPAWLPEKFRPLRPLGKGGMGEVWLVEEIATGRAAACKALRLEMAPEELQAARLRFKREFLVLSGLAHPGIARAHELFEPAGALVYSMDFVDGWLLRDYFLGGHWAGGAPTPDYFSQADGLAKAAAVGAELLALLDWLHGCGVIHRDLKPGNLMVDRAGRLQLIDFGLARGVDETAQVTQVGEIMGTPSYIAPEQIRGQRLDGRADLYACGVILYELLTGRLPFKGPVAEVLMAHLGQAPQAPRELNPLLSGPLSGFVLRLLAKAPQARYATAGEARRGLLGAVAGAAESQAETSTLKFAGAAPGRGQLLTAPYEGNRDAVEAVVALCRELHETGRGSLALISGSAGGGKSRLVDELKGAALERGVKVLRGACHEGAGGQLFNELFQALAEEMARHPDRAARWLEQEGELLAHHFPALRRLAGLGMPRPPELEPASARAQLMGAVYGFFSRLAREERLILAAEDLHWADAQCLELLAHLIRSFALADAGEAPLAVIANYRPEEAAECPGLEKWLAAWTGGRVVRRRLRPLDPPETSRLMQDTLGDPEPPDDATVQAVRELTGGNPFFILELLRRGIEEQALRREEPGWSLGRWLRESRSALPESLSSALERRLGGSGEKSRAALEAAAILGGAFTFDLWREVTGLGEDELLEVAERAVQREILTEAGVERLRFAHELLRRQLLHGMTALKQRRLHGRAATALIARPGARERFGEIIARHAVAAGMRDEAVAFGLPAVDGLDKAGEFDQGWALLEGIDALFNPAEPMAPPDEIETLRMRGGLLHRRGNVAEAAAILQRARARLPALPAGADRDRRELSVLKGLVNAATRQGRYAEQLELARQWLALAEAHGEVVQQAYAERSIGVALNHQGGLADAEAHLAGAARLLSGITDPAARLRVEGNIASSRSVLEHNRGRTAVAAHWAAVALQTAQTGNDKGNIAIYSGNLGELELELGRLAEAKRRLEDTRKLTEAIGDRGLLPDNLNVLALCVLHEGRPDEAMTLLQRSLGLAGEIANRYHAAFSRIYLAQAYMDLGKPGPALAQLDDAAAVAEEMNNPAVRVKVWAARAALELREGNRPAAQAAAARALELSAGRFAGDDALARTVAAGARLGTDAGAEEFTALESQLRQLIAAALNLENIPLEFELRLIAAESLHAAGHPAEALAQLADAPSRARESGFIRFADRAGEIRTAATAACIR